MMTELDHISTSESNQTSYESSDSNETISTFSESCNQDYNSSSTNSIYQDQKRYWKILFTNPIIKEQVKKKRWVKLANIKRSCKSTKKNGNVYFFFSLFFYRPSIYSTRVEEDKCMSTILEKCNGLLDSFVDIDHMSSCIDNQSQSTSSVLSFPQSMITNISSSTSLSVYQTHDSDDSFILPCCLQLRLRYHYCSFGSISIPKRNQLAYSIRSIYPSDIITNEHKWHLKRKSTKMYWKPTPYAQFEINLRSKFTGGDDDIEYHIKQVQCDESVNDAQLSSGILGYPVSESLEMNYANNQQPIPHYMNHIMQLEQQLAQCPSDYDKLLLVKSRLSDIIPSKQIINHQIQEIIDNLLSKIEYPSMKYHLFEILREWIDKDTINRYKDIAYLLKQDIKKLTQ